VCWLLKKVMGGLIFGPDFGVSRLTGGAWMGTVMLLSLQ
jgi:hypothetical protein